MQVASDWPDPILVFGLEQRTGTHFIYDALALHEDVEPVNVPRFDWLGSWEDFLVHRADLLMEYARQVQDKWSMDDETTAEAHALLVRCLGEGLQLFLREFAGPERSSSGKHLLTKTPSIENAHLASQLIPNARVAVIVRDPRSVVASGLATWGGNPERRIRMWRKGADGVKALADHYQDRLTLVRYEDLFLDPVASMKTVLKGLRLDPDRYDYEALLKMPVRGSSQVVREQGWIPTEQPADFNPLARANELPPGVSRRLGWLLADHLEYFGYPAGEGLSASQKLRQRTLDLRWWTFRHANHAVKTFRLARKSFRDQ